MITAIALPIPFDAWDTFEAPIQRFVRTFKEFPPGADYELIAVCNWGQPTDDERKLFRGIKTRFIEYYNNGCDHGSWRYAASSTPADFLICVTSRTYFHRAGWLARIVEEREKYGAGLYTTSASCEARPHACLRCFGVDVRLMMEWPKPVPMRPLYQDPKVPFYEGLAFETGLGSDIGSFGDWVENQGKAVKLVTWNGCYEKKDWFRPRNCFRSGDQSNVLVWDRHTEIYAKADEEEKKRLEQKTYWKEVDK